MLSSTYLTSCAVWGNTKLSGKGHEAKFVDISKECANAYHTNTFMDIKGNVFT